MACWELCQSSMLGDLPEQLVWSLARAVGWEPCQGSRLGALPGQQVGSLARAAGWEPCQGSRLGALPEQRLMTLRQSEPVIHLARADRLWPCRA